MRGLCNTVEAATADIMIVVVEEVDMTNANRVIIIDDFIDLLVAFLKRLFFHKCFMFFMIESNIHKLYVLIKINKGNYINFFPLKNTKYLFIY